MPSRYNLPRVSELWNQQDVNQFNKLDFYLATLEAQYYPKWQLFNKLFGSIKWQANMGNTMKGVRAEHSPIGRQMFFPNNITDPPKKDIHEVREVSETARIKRHLYESPQFAFLPSFTDFRREQIPFAVDDITMQIGVADDQFARSTIFHRSPTVYISGKAGGVGAFAGNEIVAAPVGDGSDDGSTAKTTAWLQEAASYAGNNLGNLGFKTTKKAATIFGEDIRAPFFEGGAGQPTPNEVLKGKYLLVSSNEAFEYLSFDDFVLANKEITRDVLNAEFNGTIGSRIVWKSERFPLRMLADGTFPAPEIREGNSGAYNYGEPVPNPAYVSAPYEWAFLIGGGAYKMIKVGAPPKEFASPMAEEKFRKMNWNGEVKITSDLLVNLGTAAAPVMDTNKHGEFVQLIASTVHGIIPCNRRYVLPILYRRVRVQAN